MERERSIAMTRAWLWMTMTMVAAGLAGCTKPESAATGVVTLTYQTIETLPVQQALHQQIVAAFEQAHPHIKIKVVYDPSKFTKLNTQLAGGSAPDVFYYVVDKLPALAKRGATRDLTSSFQEMQPDVFPELIAPCMIDGKLMMAPFHYSTDILFYNRDWFDTIGEPPPDAEGVDWDWAKFKEVSLKLARQHNVEYGTVLPRPLLLVQSFGGALFDNDKCVVNTPESVAALAFYRDLVKDKVAPSKAAMQESEAFDGVNLFRAQKIGMLVGRTYMLTEFDKIDGFKWGVAPVPRGQHRRSRLSIGGHCIWAGTKHPEEAWAFVKFYSTEGARIAASRRNAVPALVAASDAAEFPPVMKQALTYSRLDNPWGYSFWDEFNQKSFEQTADAVTLGTLSPEDATRTIEQLGNALVSSPR
jgi:multiple sugar transport system substrate-binding protein